MVFLGFLLNSRVGKYCGFYTQTVLLQTGTPRPVSRGGLSSVNGRLEDEIRLQLAFEEDTRKVFPRSNSGKEVRDSLLAAAARLGAKFEYGASLARLMQHDDSWVCVLANGREVKADRVVWLCLMSVHEYSQNGRIVLPRRYGAARNTAAKEPAGATCH